MLDDVTNIITKIIILNIISYYSFYFTERIQDNEINDENSITKYKNFDHSKFNTQLKVHKFIKDTKFI